MKSDEQGIAVCIRDGRAIVVRRIRIIVARHNHVIALLLKVSAHGSRKFQDHVLFNCPTLAARARVRAAVPGIEHDHGSDECCGSLRRTRGRRCLLRRRG